jgi:hypothetical protein
MYIYNLRNKKNYSFQGNFKQSLSLTKLHQDQGDFELSVSIAFCKDNLCFVYFCRKYLKVEALSNQ